MNKQTKLYLGIGLIAAAGIYLYTQSKKSAEGPVTGIFGPLQGTGCRTISGNVSNKYVGTVLDTRMGNETVVRTGGGTTTLCKRTWSRF